MLHESSSAGSDIAETSCMPTTSCTCKPWCFIYSLCCSVSLFCWPASAANQPFSSVKARFLRFSRESRTATAKSAKVKGTPIPAPTAGSFPVVAAAFVGPGAVSVDEFVGPAEHAVVVGTWATMFAVPEEEGLDTLTVAPTSSWFGRSDISPWESEKLPWRHPLYSQDQSEEPHGLMPFPPPILSVKIKSKHD